MMPDATLVEPRDRLPATSSGSGVRLWALCAFGLLLVADLVLRLGGFRCLHWLTKRWPTLGSEPESLHAVARDVRDAVDHARTYYPRRARCLQGSVAAAWLLRLRGVNAELVLGVQKFPFGAHAWVEVDGTVVNDEPDVQGRYGVLERC